MRAFAHPNTLQKEETIPYRVNPLKVTSVRAVYKLAAEIVANNMQYFSEPECRHGTCRAFSTISDAVRFNHNTLARAERNRREKIVQAAREKFREMFKPTAGPLANAAFWLGSRDNAGMKRRINCLLLAAERAR